MEHITDNEKRVLNALMKDDFISDHGWADPAASTWIDCFAHDLVPMDGLVFSGVMSSLYKKGIIVAHNDEVMGLTDKGREVCAALAKEGV